MRHVIEHNYSWKEILDNAINSFTKKFCLILFTPFGPETREIAHNRAHGVDVPDLSFCRADIEGRFSGLHWKLFDNIATDTGYGIEHVYLVWRPKQSPANATGNGLSGLVRRIVNRVGRMGRRERIEKTIHQLWIPPSGYGSAIPDNLAAHMARWQQYHPEFKHAIWSVDTALASLDPDVARRLEIAVRRCRFENMRADLIRYAVLAQHGGFWSDLKIAPKKRWLDQFLSEPLLLSEHFASEFIADPHRDNVLAAGLIGCESGNTFMKACLDRALQNVEDGKTSTCWEVVGPKLIMDVRDEMQGKGLGIDCVVLPHQEVWQNLVEQGAGEYSGGERHWVIREQNESMYYDSPSRADLIPIWRYKYL
jgi:hypothetical protein